MARHAHGVTTKWQRTYSRQMIAVNLTQGKQIVTTSVFADYLESPGIYPEITYQELIREYVSPEFANLSDAEIDDMLGEVFAEMSAEEIEGFFKSLGRIARKAGRTLAKAAPSVLPVAGGAIGTLLGGPVGTAIGAKLGGVAGGLIGRAAAPRRRRRRRRAVRGRRSAVPAGGSSATAQLLSLLNNPALLQSLLSRVIGAPGRVEVVAGGEGIDIDFGSLMNALGELSSEAAREAHEEGAANGGLPEYLLDEHGAPFEDISRPEARAELLLETLNQAEAEERMLEEHWPDTSAENWLLQSGMLENAI